jgi:hypothetical protein
MIKVNGYRMQPQVTEDSEGSWTRELRVDRWIAKGNLRAIWRQFVTPDFESGPGQAFARRPHLHRDGDVVVMNQSGGLDI